MNEVADVQPTKCREVSGNAGTRAAIGSAVEGLFLGSHPLRCIASINSGWPADIQDPRYLTALWAAGGLIYSLLFSSLLLPHS
jgi:hypothetical protein